MNSITVSIGSPQCHTHTSIDIMTIVTEKNILVPQVCGGQKHVTCSFVKACAQVKKQQLVGYDAHVCQ